MLFFFGRGVYFSIVDVLSRIGVVSGGGGEGLALLALCPLCWHWRQSPSLKQRAHSVGVSFVTVMASTSIAYGSFWE